jgi:hypothetical protein
LRNCREKWASFAYFGGKCGGIPLQLRLDGGESGIRTHVTLSSKHAFQACAFSHSAISPAKTWEGRSLSGRQSHRARSAGFHADLVSFLFYGQASTSANRQHNGTAGADRDAQTQRPEFQNRRKLRRSSAVGCSWARLHRKVRTANSKSLRPPRRRQLRH